MDVVVDLPSCLLSDYEKLYECGKYADVSIHVGREPNNKIFFAHTLILCTQCSFFENSLIGNSEIQKTAMTVEDVSPDVFEILLRFIYTGQISYDSCKLVDWISLLDGAGKLELIDLLVAIETYLLEEQKEWIQQNIITVHKYALSTAPLDRLLGYCNRLMVSHPDIVFKSNGFAALPKETLINLLKNDDLSMEEDDIWVSVVQWATKQVPGLEFEDVDDLDNWSSHEINMVKDIIADCIPHIRFFNMSPDKALLFDDLLPRKLRRDILSCQMKKDYVPSTTILLPRTGQRCNIDSVITKNKQEQYNPSDCYENGIRVEKDIEKAVELYKRAAGQGNAAAQYNLGYCYEHGIGVEKDAGKAVELYHQVAAKGNAVAQYNLGVSYENGTGIEKDKQKAVEWYQKAAEQGHVSAQCNLGVCYENGTGIEKDEQKAVEWYQKAAEQGYADAQYWLGWCYVNGTGVEKDEQKAVKWWQKAAEQGYADAQYRLALCYHYGTGVEKDDQKAVEWCQKAAEQGVTQAQYSLGLCYRHGAGVEKDEQKAVEWHQKAAEQGNADAQYRLGRCYENGTGVGKDKQKAVAWYQKAAKQGHDKAVKWCRKTAEK